MARSRLAAAKLPVPESVELKPKKDWKILGKPRMLVDAPDITQGKANVWDRHRAARNALRER